MYNKTEEFTIFDSQIDAICSNFTIIYPNLKKISFIFNKFTVPNVLNVHFDNVNLTHLDFNGNHIQNFPNISSKYVTSLKFSHNYVRNIDIDLNSSFPNLQYLNLERNFLLSLNLGNIPRTFLELKINKISMKCDCKLLYLYEKIKNILVKDIVLYCDDDSKPLLFLNGTNLVYKTDCTEPTTIKTIEFESMALIKLKNTEEAEKQTTGTILFQDDSSKQITAAPLVKTTVTEDDKYTKVSFYIYICASIVVVCIILLIVVLFNRIYNCVKNFFIRRQKIFKTDYDYDSMSEIYDECD